MEIHFKGTITCPEFEALFERVSKQNSNVSTEQKEIVSENNERLLNRKETAEILGISLVTLHKWCLEGIVPSYRINTRIRFKKEDLDKILENPRGIKYNTKR